LPKSAFTGRPGHHGKSHQEAIWHWLGLRYGRAHPQQYY